jgi:hypothetical protein
MSTGIIGLLQAAESASDGLSIGEIIADIPHDPAAFLVYALILIMCWFIWKGSRAKPKT